MTLGLHPAVSDDAATVSAEIADTAISHLAMDNVRIAMVGNGKQLPISSACSLIVHHFF